MSEDGLLELRVGNTNASSKTLGLKHLCVRIYLPGRCEQSGNQNSIRTTLHAPLIHCAQPPQDMVHQMALLASDRLQSPLLVQRSTDRIAAAYTPYGQRAPSSFPTALGFTGQPFEQALDGYVLGSYRVYSTRLMRFLSADSWSPFGAGGVNAYAYCAGDPVNRSDPSGHVDPYTTLKAGLFMVANGFSIFANFASSPPTDALRAWLRRLGVIAGGEAIAAQGGIIVGFPGSDVGVVAGTVTNTTVTIANFMLDAAQPEVDLGNNIRRNGKIFCCGVDDKELDVEAGVADVAVVRYPDNDSQSQYVEYVDERQLQQSAVGDGRQRKLGVYTSPNIGMDSGSASGSSQGGTSRQRSFQRKITEIRNA
ncbi:RHS repeat-associated core domain-containing protein [Pseudomonas sp. RtIB026]|uniref:RHS repeat-associated core domain-containing protein n=1 Tax=Pseudomonas sp. RtIB026 TaxID=2749999 RepID=UPI0019459983|nr:RHS repeat-associated core domain-containing protein [Pseudomonas sp. RtIB026]